MKSNNIVDNPDSWDEASEEYASKIAPTIIDQFTPEFVEGLNTGSSTIALEVASGTGALTAALAPKVRSLLATDFSPKMLAVNQRLTRQAGLNNIEYKVMDGQALDLDDCTFDRAACCFGLILFPDQARGFSELYRVLKPEGRAMVSGWAGPDKFESFGMFVQAIKMAFPDLPPAPPAPIFSLASLDNLEKDMKIAGFKEVEVKYVSRDMEVTDFDELWAILTAGAPQSTALFQRLGNGGKEKVQDALKKLIEERFGNGPIVLTNVATVAYGNR